MSAERAVIYVESGTSLRASSSPEKNLQHGHTHKGLGGGGSNYVIKIQIGEETMFNPVRIDVSASRSKDAGKLSCPCEESSSSSSGQSSPRSDMTPPPRITIRGGNRFGSETSESDTESDISAEFRPLSCPAAQFAMREIICEGTLTPSPPLERGGGGGVPPPLPKSTIPAPSYEEDSLSLKAVKVSKVVSKVSTISTPSPQAKPSNILGAIMTLSESMAAKRAKAEEDLEKKKIVVDECGFHVNEISGFRSLTSGGKGVGNEKEESLSNFAGYRDIFFRRGEQGPKQIFSDKGTIRGVKNRVRDGIATFLQSKDTKSYSEKEHGRVVVYTTSMGVVRATFQRCQKVKQILRNLLVKFDERDCYMNRSIQNEIKLRLPHQLLALPQIFLEGQLLGDAEVIEKLNETGELRDLLKPYKSLSVLSTCEKCGGFRMLPCPICNGSKKSVHRNHFTTEFIALKCMGCDPSGLVRCDLCNAPDS